MNHNAVNHRAVFFIMEAKGFLEEDLTLIRRMYNSTSLVMNNHFGRSRMGRARLSESLSESPIEQPSPPPHLRLYPTFQCFHLPPQACSWAGPNSMVITFSLNEGLGMTRKLFAGGGFEAFTNSQTAALLIHK